VKTRLFGTGGIDDEVKADLDNLAGLPQKDIDHLGRWLSETRTPIPFAWSDIGELIEGTSLNPKTANRALTLLRYLLTNWRTFGLTIDDVKSDIGSLAYKEADAKKILGLLEKLEPSKELIYKSALKNSYEVTALPTVDDINAVWDLRPMFAEFAYDAEPIGSAYEELVGSTYVFLLEILASREDRKKESVTYQLSEDDFDRLLETLNRARKQLEIIKKRAIL
jgi:hypothetical protein